MDKKHIVKQGECLLSIAYKARMPVERIEKHPDNVQLMRKRQLNILLPGDVLTIPEKQLKEESAETGKRHRFRRILDKAEIRIRIYEFGEPRADEPYYILVGNERYEGDTQKTDKEGLVVCQIPPDVEKVTIVVGEYEDEYEVYVGQMDPVDTVTGIHERLQNLGLYDGGIETPYDGESITAMSDFLLEQGPNQSDRDYSDPASRQLQKLLKDQYGS